MSARWRVAHVLPWQAMATLGGTDHPIAQQRVAAGLTVRELAQQAGINRVTLVRLENRHHDPTLATLGKLAAALGVAVQDLIDEEEGAA